ncbi:MAG: ABC transporter permease [Clostridia bacterium]|nr:ABC transporter permease [Clostridia bacterium]
MKRFSINTIALGNLRQHRKQYTSLTVGIILALFFSAALMLFWNSMKISTQEIHDSRYGTQDIIFLMCADDAHFYELADAGYLQALGKASILEYFSLETPDLKSGFSAATFDDAALELIDWDVIEGRLPEKAGEIAIEQSALARLRLDIEVGDTFTAPVYIPTGGTNYMDGTFLDEPIEKTYTLVGILSDHLTYLSSDVLSAVYGDIPAAVLADEEEITVGGIPVINFYAQYSSRFWAESKLPGAASSYNKAGEIVRDYCYSSLETYNDTELYGSIDIQNTNIFIYFMFVIAFALIFASCLGIINAFSANLRERQRQIGMLRAVAATRRQIRQIFGREAILIALISIPPAVVLSCLAVWGIMQLMGPGYHFVLNLWILLGTAVLGLLCIMAASFIPLWKVSRIPPMQAIRDVSLSRKLKSRHIRTKKLFDVPKHLAKRNLSLNRGNQVRIIALMTAGMFILSTLCYTNIVSIESLMPSYETEYDYSLSSFGKAYGSYSGLEWSYSVSGMTEQDVQAISSLQSVQTVHSQKEIQINVIPEKITDYLPSFGMEIGLNLSGYLLHDLPLTDSEMNTYYQEEYQRYLQVKRKYDYIEDYYTSFFYAYDEEQLQSLSSKLLEGEINLDKLASGEQVLVYAPAYSGAYQTTDDFLANTNGYAYKDYTKDEADLAKAECEEYLLENDMFHVGDTITLSQLYTTEELQYISDGSLDAILPDDVTRIDREVTIGGIIDGSDHTKGSIVTSIAGLAALGYDAKYSSVDIQLSESPSKQMEQYLDDNLNAIAARSGTTEVVNLIARARTERNLIYGRMAAGLSIVILLFAICTSMVCNSFATQIQAGKSYIGTLRAIGASQQDMWKNYRYQMIYLFLCGTVIGILFECLVLNGLTLLRHYRDGLSTWVYAPILPPIVFILLMFLICYCTTRIKLKQVLKSSIVQNIREL